MSPSSLKTRFCPSPTGLLHLGNVRTALFNYLFAKSKQGCFLLRIEDTDLERSKETFTDALMRDLHWLGLEWDEGSDKDQGNGPYHQSKRQAVYDDYYERLEGADEAYPCFCSEEQLVLSRKIQRAAGNPPRYAGTCRMLTEEQIKEKLEGGIKPTLRFEVPQNEVIQFHDLVRGEQQFQSDDIGDFIIRRADGTPPFMFCNAIDDALMGVTHVLRGEDHLTNTPRQIMLLEALGLPIPTYAHIALIVGPDGSPLSKRHGSRSLEALRDLGYLPSAIINYLARLGHYYEKEAMMDLAELAERFKVESLNKSPAKFNIQQLDYWQKRAIEHLSDAELWIWLDGEQRYDIPSEKRELFLEAVKPNIRFPNEAAYWFNVCFRQPIEVNAEGRNLLQHTNEEYFNEALEAFDQHENDVNKIIAHLKTTLQIKGKTLYQPLRIALTGVEHGPELAKLFMLIEPQWIKQRLEQAKQLATT